MNSEKLFQILSYAAVLCGFLALWISGIFGVIGTFLFLAALIGGWFLEGTRWQVSERIGTILIVLSLPCFYALNKVGFFPAVGSDSALPGILARLIVSLSAIKILQRKSDRDWIFLYLMSFFQVLLAAGLSISAFYFVLFISYVFIMVSTIVLFEIRKTKRAISSLLIDSGERNEPPGRRIPAAAVVLIVFIIALATPMFFLLPRVGGAGFGGGSGNGPQTASGFSNIVQLGRIGRIQQNDEVVMRVRIEGTNIANVPDIRWRGLALDTFDNKSWSKETPGFPDRLVKGDRDLIQVDTRRSAEPIVVQTFYLEPIDSPIIFALPRAVGIQGAGLFVERDSGGSLRRASQSERISYRALSETTLPDPALIRRDNGLYGEDYFKYLQLPEDLDPRIGQLATEITRGTRNRYDSARAIEHYLQTELGYTLEQKAGGDQPLADFLFNVREGHCEYFATAMVIMLRTQGIASRVVNGFQRGEYNETADVFVVRQTNAHSWVEAYFPKENAWITFDPTPFAGQNLSSDGAGITKRIRNYIDALETYWIQYFVAYDSAEQRSLLTSIRRGAANYGRDTSAVLDSARKTFLDWWSDVRGDAGFGQSVTAIGWGLASVSTLIALILLFVWLYRWIVKLPLWRKLREWLLGKQGASIIEFYQRMLDVLASKGFVREPHQTPLEFAYAARIPEVVSITQKYNSVRFGGKELSASEAEEIAAWLHEVEASDRQS